MAPADVLITSLLFPSVAAVAGAYLVFRGMRRMGNPGESVICGKVRCKKPVKALATGRDCVMCSTIVEAYKNGKWRRICSVRYGTAFFIGRQEAAESASHLVLSEPTVIHGTIPHEKGAFEAAFDKLKGSAAYKAAAPLLAYLPFMASPLYGPLKNDVYENIRRHPEVQTALKRHKASTLRITEHILADGMGICAITGAIQKGGILRGTAEFPLILSDMKPGDAAESVKERGLISMAAGVALLLLSASLFLFLLA